MWGGDADNDLFIWLGMNTDAEGESREGIVGLRGGGRPAGGMKLGAFGRRVFGGLGTVTRGAGRSVAEGEW